VPVLAQTVGAKEASRVLVSGGKASISLPGCGAVLVNAGQAGYYRTQYAPQAYAALAASFAKLAPVDQLGLMTDSWALGLAGRQPASDALALAANTPADAAPQVWGKVLQVFRDVNFYMRGDPARSQKLAAFAIPRLLPVMQRTGWNATPGEAAPVAILREELIQTLSALGEPGVIAEARRRYAASRGGDQAALPPELRRVVLAVVARHADAATWDELHAAAKAEQSSIVKAELYALLGQAADPALAQRALALSIGGEPDATIAAGIISTVAGERSELAFDFAIANLARVNELVEANSRATYFPRLAGSSLDPAMIAKLKAYADANLPATARSNTNTAISRMQYRAVVLRERLPEIDSWLARSGS
jgi:aminopeptidase N